MYLHNLKLGFRHLFKNKALSIINIGGLAMGMTVAMLMALWIQDEISFDQFHDEGDHIYTVKRHVFSEDEIHTSDRVTFNIAGSLEQDYPEVSATAIVTYPRPLVITNETNSFRELGVYATPSFFEIFSWELLQGDPTQLLQKPDQILLSVSLAERYFGPNALAQNQVIGQQIEHQAEELPALTVAGVFKDIPRQSSLQFDYVLPMQTYESNNQWMYNWNNSGIRIFAQLQPGTDVEQLSEKIVNIQNDHIESFRSDLFLQAYPDQYLYSNFKDGKQAGGRILYVRIFVIVAIFLILIACINFMNLSTARALQRVKEIGVRKAIGAERKSLIAQFMSESFILMAIAFCFAIGLVLLCLPLFNNLASKEIALQDFNNQTLIVFLGIGLLTTLVASTYPALYLSSFDAIKIIRGSFKQNVSSTHLRRGLVVFQFGMSILLIVGAITVQQQINYIQNKNLGLDRENVLFLRMEGPIRQQYNRLKEELLT
ncbi:MAG: ABC transporter permease, partial [Bacteroidota bacterium]